MRRFLSQRVNLPRIEPDIAHLMLQIRRRELLLRGRPTEAPAGAVGAGIERTLTPAPQML
jgi:hypothetical protein